MITLNLPAMKANLAKLRDRTDQQEAAQRGAGDMERASLAALNLAAYMGETYTGPLIAEVERLRAEEQRRHRDIREVCELAFEYVFQHGYDAERAIGKALIEYDESRADEPTA